ncbi:MAG: hypothetical protein K0R26_2185 [Bacteroidota bacterium]|jgi:hypothetical protein|nr:hypothetical protein [Bacteroidota bacterium]
MRAFIFSFISCVSFLNTFAQDTIFFKTNNKLVVIVKEVSPSEIHYKKPELIDGPMYVISKSDVDKIIYKNGVTDVFKTASEEPKTGETFVIYKGGDENINTEKITYRDTKKPYYRLVNLVDRHPDVKRRDRLREDAIVIRNLKRHQNGTRTCAIIFGGVALAGVALYSMIAASSYNGYVDPIYSLQPLIFGTLGLGFGGASIAVTLSLKKKRTDFVKSYND